MTQNSRAEVVKSLLVTRGKVLDALALVTNQGLREMIFAIGQDTEQDLIKIGYYTIDDERLRFVTPQSLPLPELARDDYSRERPEIWTANPAPLPSEFLLPAQALIPDFLYDAYSQLMRIPNQKKEKPMTGEKQKDDKVTVHVVEVVRHGEKMVIPETVSIDEAIRSLQRKAEEEESTVTIEETFEAFIWDGALAAEAVAKEMFGYALGEVIPGSFFFPAVKPERKSIETNWRETVQVAWGRYTVPGIDGYFQTSYTMKNERYVFQLTGEAKHKHQGLVKQYADAIRAYLLKNSIYKGKAFEVTFTDKAGKTIGMPMPSFLDINEIRNKPLIFSREVTAAVQHNLFAPIEQTEACRSHKIPLKRGIIMSGPYGVGKTLAAGHLALTARENGWTFIYCSKPEDLVQGLKLAAQYTPSVVFCEDVDREVAGETRTDKIDTILNTLDGVNNKNAEIMTVLTTNNLDTITRAMLRPGRVDALIEVTPPDAEAVQRLIHLYGRGLIDADEDLEDAGAELRGEIPAIIAEVVEKAKLAAVYNTRGQGSFRLTGTDLYETAVAMRAHRRILRDKVRELPTPFQQFGVAMGSEVAHGMLKLACDPNLQSALTHLIKVGADPAGHDCETAAESVTALGALAN